MPTYLVTGAARGLGYALLKTLAANPENTVIGLVRDKAAAEKRMQPDGVNAHIVEADVTDQAALYRAAETAKALLDGAGIDVVILNAAYVSDRTALKSLQDFENDAQPALDDMQKSFDVNVLGVLKTVTAFLPLVQQGTLKKMIAVSSGMGDIDFINETQLPIAAPYAVSKAALNALVAKFAAAYADQGILFASICPGRVDTAEPGASLDPDDLARLAKYAPRFEQYSPGFQASTPDAAAASLLAAIERSSLEGGYSGSFLSHNGTKRWM